MKKREKRFSNGKEGRRGFRTGRKGEEVFDPEGDKRRREVRVSIKVLINTVYIAETWGCWVV